MLVSGKRLPAKPVVGPYFAVRDGMRTGLFVVCSDPGCGCGESWSDEEYYEAVSSVKRTKKRKKRTIRGRKN